jgi:hypothetical protein
MCRAVDSLRLDNLYGVLAFVLGRIVLLVAGVPSMVLGAALGAANSGRLAVVATVVLVGLVMAASIPASTPAIAGADGK